MCQVMNNVGRLISKDNIFSSESLSVSPESVVDDLLRPVTTLPQWDQAGTSQLHCYNNGIAVNAANNQANEEPLSHDSALKSEQGSESDNYENYAGSANGEDQYTSGISIEHGNFGKRDSQADSSEGPPRKKRSAVPADKKDNKYWDRRKKNNEAAKRSRDLRKKRIEDEIKSAKDSIAENQRLKHEIEVLKAEISSLRRLLRDANMTLSLWIRARQTTESSNQLPPMLRGPNVQFVNFPVSSSN